jgi:hypothetical protein
MHKAAILASLLICGCAEGPEATDSASAVAGTTTFNVSADNAPLAYTINAAKNPILTVKRGVAYTFNLNVTGYPFFIMNIPGTNTANQYTNGVIGNGNSTGQLIFTVPSTAPATLYYGSSTAANMSGTLSVVY